MTITLTSTGSSDITLCHGSATIGTPGQHIGPLGNIRTEAEWTIRPKRPIGAHDETPLDGGHAIWPYAFSTWVEFATEAACEQFADTWAASLPRTGASLTITYATHTTTRANAILKKCTVQQYCARAQVNYLFQTSRPTNTTPEA